MERDAACEHDTVAVDSMGQKEVHRWICKWCPAKFAQLVKGGPIVQVENFEVMTHQ